jgi:hypothetical protein
MSRAAFILHNAETRRRVLDLIARLPWNYRIEIKSPQRTLDQNSKLWPMLTEVAAQVTWRDLLGRPRKLTTDKWKIFFLDMLNSEADLVPNADGTGYVNLGRSSSDLGKEEFSNLIECIYKFGAERGVVFSDPGQASQKEAA